MRETPSKILYEQKSKTQAIKFEHKFSQSIKVNQELRQKSYIKYQNVWFSVSKRLRSQNRRAGRTIPRKSSRRRTPSRSRSPTRRRTTEMSYQKTYVDAAPMLSRQDVLANKANAHRAVTPFIQKLESLAVQTPTFQESFWANKNVGYLTKNQKSLKFEKLKQALITLNKKTHVFFQESNRRFISNLTIAPTPGSFPKTVKWSQPEGLLKSFQAPEWQLLFKIVCGKDVYPINFNPITDNIFEKKTLKETFLLNPPYTDYSEPYSMEAEQPLRNHVQKIIELAFATNKPQLVMFPHYREMPKWFIKHTANFFITPMFFQNEIVFSRGKNNNLVGLAEFKIVILIIGCYSPTNLIVRNNELGNFHFKAKALTRLKNLFQNPHLSTCSHFLPTFLQESLEHQQKCHNVWEQQVIKFPEIKMTQESTKYEMDTKQECQSQLLFFQQGRKHSYYVDRMLKVPNKSKKVTLPTIKIKMKAGEQEKTTRFCSWCGQGSHFDHTCMLRPQNNCDTPARQDLSTLQFIKQQKPLKLQQKGELPPSLSELKNYLIRIVNYAKELKTKAPKTTYYKNVHFATLRNFWHTSLALGNPTAMAAIFFRGYNLMTKAGPKNYPNTEILANKKTRKDKEKLWQHVLKLLQENKIWACEREKIHTIAPIFLLEGYNSVGKWKERLIHDFSWYSEIYPAYTYRLPTPTEVRAKMSQYICITVDIRSAFPHAHFCDTNLVGFPCEDPMTGTTHYFASASPLFGMQAAPYICYTFLRYLADFFDRLNFPTLAYVDDFKIGIAKISENLSDSEITARTEFVKEVFTIAGMRLSPKIKLIPSTFNQYIGKYFETTRDVILPNIVKLPFLYEQLMEVVVTKKAKVKLLDSLRGKLAYHASYAANIYTRMFNKLLSALRKKFHEEGKTEKQILEKVYHKTVEVDDNILNMIVTFSEAISKIYVTPEQDKIPQKWEALLTVDASVKQGGGALIWPNGEFECVTFNLSPELDPTQEHSSTLRELIAVRKIIQHFYPKLITPPTRTNIVILNDNKINVQHLVSLNPRDPKIAQRYYEYHNFINNLPLNIEYQWVPREDLLARVADKESKNIAPVLLPAFYQELQRLGWHESKTNVYTHGKEISNFNTSKLHKLRLNNKRPIVIVLPVFTESNTFRNIIEIFHLLKLGGIIFHTFYRMNTFKPIIRKHYPRVIPKKARGPIARYRYQRKRSTWYITHIPRRKQS